jgi:hypothetical protein
MDEIVDLLVAETEKLAVRFTLKNITTEEEKTECGGLLERSLQAHPELLRNFEVEDLHLNYMQQYDSITAKMSAEEKKVFTPDFYEALVQCSMRVLTCLKGKSPVKSRTEEEEE